MGKIVIYQVLTRLFGNLNGNNRPWGTKQENGVGKFADFTDQALQEIKKLGVTHIWYTGVLHHAMVADYRKFGISDDHPSVVKGRAGSPYAVKDYFQVNPDLAIDPANRMREFEELVVRTHSCGLKVIIDIVPNHVARKYEGMNNPPGVQDFGAHDITDLEYERDNNFYYIPGRAFELPDFEGNGYVPLGGLCEMSSFDAYEELPAKWTGNGSRSPRPDFHDWYETVKLNFGIRPDGTKEFDSLPEALYQAKDSDHFEFWQHRNVPDTWSKFRSIVDFWLSKGVDGFRFDMAEMVPVEFWSYLNAYIKEKNDAAITIAEVYNPDLYRAFIQGGRMDYLYDKVQMYDAMKHIMKGYGWTDHISTVRDSYQDITPHMLQFLENHDEERIASEPFVGDPKVAKPAMVVSTLISEGPIMLYFGQEVGEPAAEDAGFGSASRTSVFDYIGVPNHQRWMNGGRYDGGLLNYEERELRDFYVALLSFASTNDTVLGHYAQIHFYNKEHTIGYDHRIFAFVRWSERQLCVVVCNFEKDRSFDLNLKIPNRVLSAIGLGSGCYAMEDVLGSRSHELNVLDGLGEVAVQLSALESLVLCMRY